MTTTRNIAHNTIIQIGGKAISTLLGLAAVFLLTRYLGPEKFGWYSTVIIFLQFIGILTDFGLTPVTSQMLSKPGVDKVTLLKNLLGFRLVTAVVGFGIAPLLVLLFPYPAEVKQAVSFTTISFLAIALNQVFMGFYQTQLKMYIEVIGEVLGRIVLVAGLWFLGIYGASFLPMMGMITLGSVVYTAYVWWKARSLSPIGFAYNKEIWKEISLTMWPIAVAIVFNTIYLKGDAYLLTWYRSQEEVGFYNLSYRVIDIVTQVAMMTMGILLPLLSYAWNRNLKEEFKKRYQQAFDTMMLIGLPSSIAIGVLAKHAILTISGQEYLPAVAPLQILSLAIFGLYLGAVFGHAVVAINKQKVVLWVYFSNAVITLLGYLLVIPKYGMIGAAWMTVFSELYAGVGLYLVVRQTTKEKLQVRSFAKMLFAAIVMGCILFLFRDLHLILLLPLGAAVYFFFVYGLGVISKETLQEIFSLRNKASDTTV